QIRSERDLRKAGIYLSRLARHAHLLRQTELVHSISQVILELPLPPEIQCMGTYYPLLSSSLTANNADFSRMKSELVRIADSAAPGLRERGMLQVARTHFRSGDLPTAFGHFAEVARAAKGLDPLTYLQAQRYAAVCRSIEGDHSGALSHLNQLQPVLDAFRYVYPTEYLDQLNSRAVELGQLGRVDEARRLLAIPLASSLSP